MSEFCLLDLHWFFHRLFELGSPKHLQGEHTTGSQTSITYPPS